MPSHLEQLQQLPECCYRVSVKALIKDKDGRVLVIKEGDEYWDLPGGGTDHDEDIVVSIQRELHEEIGLDITVGGFYDCIKFTSLNGINALWLIYECTAESSELILGHASEAAWLKPDELTSWPLHLIDGLG